ncbi:MAG: peptidoglycan DD-metalloendopeptidase family protein [Gammaproteobacteria bacterium]|nr:peptidoglycan DD-metalloendopeptidase family protein [Gammaproteobacteria bacterium]MBU2676501.1 peptidoglycan DD-metalloendopeptidase family protein [Gammaproteobacteria bacterium]NNC56192.1 peptidoglycan DD-metalloendopeptidase family protein [Woeseiaceae bacterium]NNL50236.1 peptidoglycan DD-metalloendopeptidase family protein [Woeseiaceae bacterium]
MKWQFILIATVFVAAPTGYAEDKDSELTEVKERELEDVRERISALKESMDRISAERDKLAAELQELEIAISEQRTRLKDVERQQRSAIDNKQQLEAELVESEAHLDKESAELAAQVRAAYMNGSQEKIRLLLNQRDPATLGRLMIYYRYLSDYRAENIAAVVEEIRKLDVLHVKVAAEEARLAELAKTRYAELTRLNEVQEGRATLLASLRQRIDAEGQEVGRLAAQEKDLTRLIAELSSILSDYPISSEAPFSEHKGALTWPVAGTLVRDFGQPRVGGNIKWNGVVLEAPRGREIRAVYHGRVAFADWLAGMGLLVIVDHGEGYMTLYGYNETILKNAGDWVAPGDVIATVGDSGGQPQAGLYFELRRGTQPVNPRQWVTRRPGG